MGGRVSHLPYRLCILHPPVVRRFELSFPLHRNVPAYTSFVTLLHSLLFIQAGGRNLLVCIVQYLFAVVRSMPALERKETLMHRARQCYLCLE